MRLPWPDSPAIMSSLFEELQCLSNSHAPADTFIQKCPQRAQDGHPRNSVLLKGGECSVRFCHVLLDSPTDSLQVIPGEWCHRWSASLTLMTFTFRCGVFFRTRVFSWRAASSATTHHPLAWLRRYFGHWSCRQLPCDPHHRTIKCS